MGGGKRIVRFGGGGGGKRTIQRALQNLCPGRKRIIGWGVSKTGLLCLGGFFVFGRVFFGMFSPLLSFPPLLLLAERWHISRWRAKLSDPRNRNHKLLAIANRNFEVASFSHRNRNEIAVLQVFSESQWFFWVVIAIASDLRFEVAAIQVTRVLNQHKLVSCYTAGNNPATKSAKQSSGPKIKMREKSVLPKPEKSTLWTNAGQDWNFQKTLSAVGTY